MVFQCICHDSFKEDVEESKRKQAATPDSRTCPKPISYLTVEAYCAGGLAVKASYDFDQVSIDVVQLHGGPKGCMPYSVKCLLKIYKDMIKVLLIIHLLEIVKH